jgi:hypothetical protein
MRLTKLDMARVIVAATYNMEALPAGDDRRVLYLARHKAEHLKHHHKIAMKVFADRAAKKETV